MHSAKVVPLSVDLPLPTVSPPRTPLLLSSGLRRLDEKDRDHALTISTRYVSKRLKGNEEVIGSWSTIMHDENGAKCDSILVLTTAALYRIQYLVEHGYVNRCRQMPLETLSRVYVSRSKSHNWVTISERYKRKGNWEKFMGYLTKHEPSEARPWRDGSHIVNTRWYMPLVVGGGRSLTKCWRRS